MNKVTADAVIHIANYAVFHCNAHSLKGAKGCIHGVITSYGEQGINKDELNSIFADALSAKRKETFKNACNKAAVEARWSKKQCPAQNILSA
ncbi:hypothetical protein [Cedecea colo]|uniref:Uncharacterized protein n=1 Tax=Cedecea colo TaxID=2552946 RepID=A0ABX0VJT9_9ENTR|nr:hypothetical protein [Cedecea colo]NIY47307.1 hypothetical protein [Cedecea colo]